MAGASSRVPNGLQASAKGSRLMLPLPSEMTMTGMADEPLEPN